MRRVRAAARALALGGVTITAASCEQIIGLDQFHDVVCERGQKQEPNDCPYPGPAGTKDVGICRAGFHLCAQDQQSWTECTDPVLPAAEEDCSTPEDDNCNGEVNEASAGCCTPGTMVACYDGPPGTEGKGICKGGMQACGMKSGKPEGACAGEVKPQQETCTNHEDDDCDGHECIEWAELFGDAADQAIGAAAVDVSGNVVVVGQLHGSIVLPGGSIVKDAGAGDAFVLKLDGAGKPLWGQSLGDIAEQAAESVAVDSAGDVVIGGVSASVFQLGGSMIPAGVFVVKLDGKDGHVLWAKGLGGSCPKLSDARVNSIATTTQNDIAIAGAFCGSIDFGDGPLNLSASGQDAYVAFLRGGDGSSKKADGYWGRVFGDQENQRATGVAVAKNGHVLATGSFQGSIFLGTGFGAGATGGYDVFVVELGPDGAPASNVLSYGGAGDDQAVGIKMTSTGDYVLAGAFTDSIDLGGGALTGASGASSVFLAKFANVQDLYYQHQWSTVFGGAAAGTMPSSLDLDPMDRPVLAGLFSGQLKIGADVLDSMMSFGSFVSKADSMGNGIWGRAVYGDVTAISLGVAVATPTGEVFLAGRTPAPLDFGTGPLTPKGTDAFVAKFGL
jgi:hypothetical protein